MNIKHLASYKQRELDFKKWHKNWQRECWDKLRAIGFRPKFRVVIKPPDIEELLQDEDFRAQAAAPFPNIDEIIIVPERATVEMPSGSWMLGNNLQIAVRVIFFTHPKVPNAFGCLVNGKPKILPVYTTESETANWFADIQKRNAEAGLEMPAALKTAFAKEAKSKAATSRTQSLPEILKFYNDPIHGGSTLAFARVSEWGPKDGFSYGFEQVYADANITIGLPDGQILPGLWEFLRKGGPRMVKAHYALWARYFERDEHGPRFAMVSVPQFCADIGLKKHKNGGYRPEQKREAMKLLQALAKVEMRVEKTLPNDKRVRLRGPIWLRGVEAEEKDQYSDLFGQAREGEPAQWEPVSFSFMPGQFFDNPDWRAHHRYIGKISAGLMRLDNRDEWAILIGGYLASLARIGQYRTRRLKIGTILKAVGLAQSEDAQQRATVWQGKLWAALDKLAAPEIAVIQSWRLPDVDTSEPDMDDADALAEYGGADIYPPGDWRNWIVEITLPFEADRHRLEEATKKAIGAKNSQATKKAAQRAKKREPKESE